MSCTKANMENNRKFLLICAATHMESLDFESSRNNQSRSLTNSTPGQVVPWSSRNRFISYPFK